MTILESVWELQHCNAATARAEPSVFDKLPSPFDLHELRRLKGAEFNDGALYTIISRWKSEGWIEKKGKGMWIKKK